jgi:hypothetical protein
VYISRLVKTRDPYPGLLQFAIKSCFPFPFSLPFFVTIPLLLSLSTLLSHHRLSGGAVTPFSLSLIIDLVEVLLRPFHSTGT